MKISIPYGDGKIKIEIPNRNTDILRHRRISIKDERSIIENALKKPVSGEPLEEFIKNRNIVLIVNDHTRPTPTPQVLATIRKKLNKSRMKIIVATGTHRTPTENEFNTQIFGSYYEEFKHLMCVHDCKDKNALVHCGTTEYNNDIWLNKQVYTADRIVTINSVEPHYFAGYTGGRKSIVPGVAGFETIESNHRLALHKDAQALKLEGNPVNEDMECAVRLLDKEIFGIQLVVSDKICYASAGSMNDAFKACVKKAEEVFTLKVKDRADVVVTVANHPMDIDLYQSQKAIDNAKHALKKDGIIILVSACRMGIGGKDFYNLLSTRTTPEAVFEEIKKGYKFGYHKAAKLAEVMLYAQIWAVTNLHPDILKKINFKPYARLENAINDALLQKGKDAHIIFLIDGSTTIPVV